MINLIFTFRKDLENKHVYIWNINNEALKIFTLLAFRRVNITGFISDNKKFTGQCYLNRTIVGLEHLKDKKDVLIVVPDECDMSQIKALGLPENIEILPYSEVLCIHEKLKGEGVIVYGTGAEAEEIYQTLCEQNVKIKAFCVSRCGEQRLLHGCPVTAFDDLNEKSQYPVVIGVRTGKYKKQIRKKLNACGVKDIFLKEITGSLFEQEVFFPAIHKALEDHKKIYIYGCRDETAQILETVLSDYQIEVEGYIGDEESSSQNISSVYDLSYTDLSKLFVIINEEDGNELQRMCETLDSIGFSLEDFNYTAMGRTTLDYDHEKLPVTDILTGEGWLVNEEYPGFFVYGKSRPSDIKILVTGGSTSSDGLYRPKCWSKYLYEKLAAKGHAVTIYNCAYPGYDAVQELLHLIRDGSALKPDLVISMSGYNNTVRKEKADNQFSVEYFIDWVRALDPNRKVMSGLKCEENIFDFWLRMETIMRKVSELYGADFFAFLQPMKYAQKELDLFETSVFEQEKRIENIKEFAGHTDMAGVVNLISRFDNEEKMFIDQCHYSDPANEMLADIVYNYILGSIEKFETRNMKNQVKWDK